MIGEREKLLSLIAEDPFNLLKQRSTSRQGAHNIVLLNNFEEIVSFYEDNKREPADDINNIKSNRNPLGRHCYDFRKNACHGQGRQRHPRHV